MVRHGVTPGFPKAESLGLRCSESWKGLPESLAAKVSRSPRCSPAVIVDLWPSQSRHTPSCTFPRAGLLPLKLQRLLWLY